MDKSNLQIQFILNDGNEINMFTDKCDESDLMSMLDTIEEDYKNEDHFMVANYFQIKELHLNDKKLEHTDYNIPMDNVILWSITTF